MFIDLSPEQRQLQAELRQYFSNLISSDEAKAMESDRHNEAYRAVIRRMGQDGKLGVGWPKEFGGLGFGPIEQQIFVNEAHRADVPLPAVTLQTVGPTLQVFGSDAQKKKFLPAILAGEVHFAIGYTEPEAGTDLASLRSTASRTDSGWLLNGQKIWSSRAPFCDRAFGLFRSDPEAERHRGLTYFMFDLKATGITVRPIAQLGGDTGFGEIFFDDVFVPDNDVIGEVHDGWRAAMSTSSNERGMSLRSPARFLAPAERLVAQWKDDPDPVFTDRVADAWIKAQAYRLHTFGTVTRLAEGGELGAESSVTKVFWSDLDVAIHQTALDMQGADGELVDFPAREEDRYNWTDRLLFALGGPIYAGTNEIQRNIIAERLLGLPREKTR